MKHTVLSVCTVVLALVAYGGAQTQTLADTIPLPTGFRPEGIVTGEGAALYAGSLANGAVYRADLTTGEGEVFIEGQEGRVAVGLGFDPRTDHLFVAGGMTGQAYVYDVTTGEMVATYTLNESGTFVNDVVVTEGAAYFTNSNEAVLYRVPLGEEGSLPDASAVEEIALTGDFELVEGFNANGIVVTDDGDALIMVQSATGDLYRIDPATGATTRVELTQNGEAATVPNGDGLLLEGNTLYVVQNRDNQIAVVELSGDLSSGEITSTLTDPALRVPTTLASYEDSLYAVNARFGIEEPGSAEYEVVRVDEP